MLLSKCDDKIPRFIIKQKARRLLSELGIKSPLRNGYFDRWYFVLKGIKSKDLTLIK